MSPRGAYLGSVSLDEVHALPAGESHIGNLGGHTSIITATVTRPSNTTAYDAGDAVTNSTSAPVVITLSGMSRVAGGSGLILKALLVDSASQATKPSIELWIFSATVTPDNDNTVFTPTDAELATLVDIIPFTGTYVGDATVGAGGNCVLRSDTINAGFKCATGSRDLYALLVVRNAYTPVSAEVFTLILEVVQD